MQAAVGGSWGDIGTTAVSRTGRTALGAAAEIQRDDRHRQTRLRQAQRSTAQGGAAATRNRTKRTRGANRFFTAPAQHSQHLVAGDRLLDHPRSSGALCRVARETVVLQLTAATLNRLAAGDCFL